MPEDRFAGFELREELLAVNSFTTPERVEPCRDLLAQFIFAELEQLVALFHQAKRFADDFARGVVTAGLDLALNELFQLWREMNIHDAVRLLCCRVSLARLLRLSNHVNVGQAGDTGTKCGERIRSEDLWVVEK